MQKKTAVWMTLSFIAAGVAAYYFRRRNAGPTMQPARNHKKDKHLTQVFSKAKGYSGGEFTL